MRVIDVDGVFDKDECELLSFVMEDGEMSEDDVLTDAELIDTEPQELSISEDALEFIGE